MSTVVTPPKYSGTKVHAKIQSDAGEEELGFFAFLFNRKIKKDIRGTCIEVSLKEREQVMSKYNIPEGKINPDTCHPKLPRKK